MEEKKAVTRRIQAYLKRLTDGEELENVRADFVREFQTVDAAEIMQAEQELIRSGTPVDEVRRLCDVHAALFHGKTLQEQQRNATRAFAETVREQRMEKTAELVQLEGHPLQMFTKENEALKPVLEQARKAADQGQVPQELIGQLKDLTVHYAKKGDLIYPLLKVTYEVSGPSDVMWTVDDEIRDELSALTKTATHQDADWLKRFEDVLHRADEMIYKEANILFPNCALYFTEEQWYGIYQDAKDYDACFGVIPSRWEAAETIRKKTPVMQEDEIVMPGGHLSVRQLTAILNTLPMEITFVDADNINRFFNEGPKVFKRPGMAIDREVFSCHPPKVETQVRKIIDAFRAGTMDKVPVPMEKNGRRMLVTYLAVRDADGTYLGTMELVQDM